MNANAEKWCKALESGKYKQGKDALRPADNTYCCLGVACEISRLDEWDDEGAYDFERSWLPESVREWLGLKTPAGDYRGDFSGTSLTKHNDCGVTFKEIADLIRSEPEGLFE